MKINLFLVTITLLSCLLSCDAPPNQEPMTDEKEGRNMFGLHIPRGLTIANESLTPGYVMYAVPNSPYVYLVDRQGKVVHQWKGNYAVSHAYLMDDGSLFQGAEDPDYPTFGFGGPYGRIQKIDWDSNMLWDFEYATEANILHHDFAVLPNGNLLAIAYEAKSVEEALALGRKPDKIPKSGLWLEKIIEIEPMDNNHGKIVWEWYVEDHLIQDFDPEGANYSNPAEHPELFDLNLGHPIPPSITQDSLDILRAQGMAERNQTVDNKGSDIFHFNAIDYNAELDQIVFGSPELSEIFIIDHSTSTEEAAGHSGGRYGKGGDLLYRWGNPQNYQHGDSTNRQLFYQHNVRWIASDMPGAGNLTLFNNHPPGEIDWNEMGNFDDNYSVIFELQPPIDQSGNYIIENGQPYGPKAPVWQYMASDTLSFYSSFISGAHRMKNGHTFINEGAKGRFFEVTPDGEIVWEFLNPYRGEIRKPNGDPIPAAPFTYWLFRSTFVPADHPALAGRTLEPLDPQPEVFKLPAEPSQ